MRVVNALSRYVVPGAAIVVAALAIFVVVDRLAVNERAAERRALLTRDTELTGRALIPGSPLGCLNGGSGDTLENACEKALFASASSTAAALAFTAARLSLLQDAAAWTQRHGDDAGAAFAGVRRAVELDRYGLAAQVLADRDGCTPEQCPAFAVVKETGALKANLKAHVFDQYVSRHAPNWERTLPAPVAVPQASVPPEQPVPPVAGVAPQPSGKPVDSKWDFPSANSIPAVSIMTTEAPRPKETPKEGGKEATKAGARDTAEALPAADGAPVPVPPRRPQIQAAPVVPQAQ